ncbi:hypothetical protein V8B97DRAFT_707566 [Scleroderma yunnanense]
MAMDGFDRFVILSQVSESAWTIHLALKGPGGRWWRGSWSAQDILRTIGVSASPQVLDSFAEKLSETFVKGELVIGNWSPEKGENINLSLGPTSKTPLCIPMVELSPTEAASYATTLLSEVALQAQARKCRLNPPMFPSVSVLNPSCASPPTARSSPPNTDTMANVSSLSAEAQQKIQVLEAELAQTRAQKTKKLLPASRPPKGISLANPHKKARKYQALEFASDDE